MTNTAKPSELLPSRWVDQTRFGDRDGNCAQAAVASILAIPLGRVPDFIGGQPSTEEFWDRFESFLLSQGYAVELRPGNRQIDGLYLASGRSSRDRSHMVVMNGGELVHDPHPSREGVKDVEYIHVLIPTDPANTRPPSSEQAGDWPESPTAFNYADHGKGEQLFTANQVRAYGELCRAAPAKPCDVEDTWKTAVLDALAITYQDAPVSAKPVEIIKQIIEWHVQVAIDPRVSKEAADLIEFGRLAQPQRKCGCGLATCVEPWEPGCGLGTSIEHAVPDQPQRQGRAVSSSGWDQDQMVEILADAPRNSLLNELIHNVAYAGCDPILQLRDSARALFDLIAPAFYTEQPASAAVDQDGERYRVMMSKENMLNPHIINDRVGAYIDIHGGYYSDKATYDAVIDEMLAAARGVAND